MTNQRLKQLTQSGRSMLEMLGVLAMIGVLSIGGVAGYRYAMEKHKVNELFNRLSLFLLERNIMVQKKDFLCYPNDYVGNGDYYNAVQAMKDWQELRNTLLLIGIGGFGACNDFYVVDLGIAEKAVSLDFVEKLNSFVQNDLIEDIEWQDPHGNWYSFKEDMEIIKNKVSLKEPQLMGSNEFNFIIKEGSW